MNVYVYKSKFTDGRGDFIDVVIARDVYDAEDKAERIVRAYDTGGCGLAHDATVHIIAECATDAASLAEDIRTALDK